MPSELPGIEHIINGMIVRFNHINAWL
jgi:hypothetical protein